MFVLHLYLNPTTSLGADVIQTYTMNTSDLTDVQLTDEFKKSLMVTAQKTKTFEETILQIELESELLHRLHLLKLYMQAALVE